LESTHFRHIYLSLVPAFGRPAAIPGKMNGLENSVDRNQPNGMITSLAMGADSFIFSGLVAVPFAFGDREQRKHGIPWCEG
jgi:hypothetical protein